MKINKILLGGLVTMSSLLFSACNDVMQGTTTHDFPTDTLAYTVAPGDTVAVNFTVESAWQLSSDAMWCKVDGMFLDTSGKSGSHSVSFVISAEGQSVDVSKASISLRMGDESRVIAIVTRKGITDAVVLGADSINYTHGQTLTIGSSTTQSLVIRKTTFDSNNLYISSNVDWLDIAREDSVITLTVKPEYQKYSMYNTTDSICFSDREKPMMRLNVQYVGMDAYDVIMDPATQWNVRVAVDGKSYKDAMYENTGEVYDAPLYASITTLNDAYTLYYAMYDKSVGCTLVDVDSTQWFAVEDDTKGNISVTFKPNEGGQRTAYVFVLPQALNDSIFEDADDDTYAVANFLFEELEGKAEIKEECEQYLVAEVVQENALAGSFHLIYSITYEYVEVELETEEMWVEFAQSMGISASNLFKADWEFPRPYIVNPMLPLDVWDPSVNNGDIQVIGVSGRQYISGVDYIVEPTMMESEGDENMLLQFKKWDIEEKFIILFVDANKIAHKALVVTPIL